jgi:azurin
MKKTFLTLTIAGALFFAACGGEQPKEENKAEETTTETTEPEVLTPLEVAIEASDDMKFNLNKIEAKEGQQIKLTLKNVGKMPKESMGHNWTLLTMDTDVTAYGVAAAGAKDTDYIPADMKSNVIVSTKMLGPGEEETLTFDAPPAGIYTFICSFPGHFGSMRGELVVN